MLGFPDRYFAHYIWSNHDAKYMFSANFQTNIFTYTTIYTVNYAIWPCYLS